MATAERGRAIGVNDSLAGVVSVIMALLTGPLIQWSGLPAAGMDGRPGVGAAAAAAARGQDQGTPGAR